MVPDLEHLFQWEELRSSGTLETLRAAQGHEIYFAGAAKRKAGALPKAILVTGINNRRERRDFPHIRQTLNAPVNQANTGGVSNGCEVHT